MNAKKTTAELPERAGPASPAAAAAPADDGRGARAQDEVLRRVPQHTRQGAAGWGQFCVRLISPKL